MHLTLPSEPTREDVKLDQMDQCAKGRQTCISHLVKESLLQKGRHAGNAKKDLCAPLNVENSESGGTIYGNQL